MVKVVFREEDRGVVLEGIKEEDLDKNGGIEGRNKRRGGVLEQRTAVAADGSPISPELSGTNHGSGYCSLSTPSCVLLPLGHLLS